jgi:hypothetical protein
VLLLLREASAQSTGGSPSVVRMREYRGMRQRARIRVVRLLWRCGALLRIPERHSQEESRFPDPEGPRAAWYPALHVLFAWLPASGLPMQVGQDVGSSLALKAGTMPCSRHLSDVASDRSDSESDRSGAPQGLW